MGKLSFCYALLAAGFTLAVLIHAQDKDQSGFISIDCGIPAGSSYTDKTTGIVYISDSNLTDTGIIRSISPEFQTSGLEQQFYNVRSFPEGVRNCYTLYPEQSKDDKYLIRARFMYGNYDGLENVPQFDLYLGVSIWDTIKLDNASSIMTTEIIIPSTNYIYVCLVNKGSGKPFISSLELRLLKNSTYQTQRLSESLVLHLRLDLGSLTNQLVRYNDDIYDRIWMPTNIPGWKILSTSTLQSTDVQNSNEFQPAPAVLRTAVIPENDAQALSFYVGESTDSISQYYVYMHFAEVERLDGNQFREFNIFLNGNLFYRSIVPSYFHSRTIFSTNPIQGSRIDFSINATKNSNLPPILNAIEIYMVKDYSQWQTHQEDVDDIMDIKSIYGVKRNWQGDPCAPKAYCWDGLNCSYEDNSSPRIISLNLSSSGLTGEIAPSIADMTLLQYLDLSNNSLSGTVPVFLSRMPYLRLLNLKGNKLTGSLPAELMERSKNGSLTLSVEENPNICLSASCEKKKNKFLVPVVASVATLSTLLIALVIFIKMRKNHANGKVDSGLEYANDSITSKNRQFTYSDVVRITKNFSRVLGKGGFGTVYHGSLDDTQQVAVKMLSSLSPQGYQEFRSEVKILMRVHHRNLATLVGYCLEGTNMGLIYEYTANGSLDRYLSGGNEYILSWEDRMRIAVDAAKGLEYLHSGCKPPIVHRDVKPSNILLNEKLQAKIGDFGICRIFPKETATSIWTDVAGTPGYLDPESSLSNRLIDKSDVYSFGIVLLKIITNQPVIAKISLENVHITEWIKSKLAEEDIRNIVDPRLGDNFNINSAWKAVEIALTCAAETSSERPTMTEVVLELKECSAVDIAQNDEGHDKWVNINLETEFTPLAR